MDYNSPENQEIKHYYVDRNVIMNAYSIVDELTKAHELNPDLGFDPFEYMQPYKEVNGEIYYDDEFSAKLEELQEKLLDVEKEIEELDFADEDLEDELSQPDRTKRRALLALKDALIEELIAMEDAEEEWPEVLEWRFVTGYMARNLEQYGEVVIWRYGFPLWGRQTSGQSIVLDYVVSKICEDLGLLVEDKDSRKQSMLYLIYTTIASRQRAVWRLTKKLTLLYTKYEIWWSNLKAN